MSKELKTLEKRKYKSYIGFSTPSIHLYAKRISKYRGRNKWVKV